MDIKGLFVSTLRSVIRVIQLIWKLKKPFCSYLSITWIRTHCIQGNNNRILTITRIIWIIRLLFTSCFNQFWLYFPKSNVNEIPAQTQLRKIRNLLLRNQTHKRLLWIAAPISYWMARSAGSPKFIYLGIDITNHLDQRITDPFFQTKSP